MGVSYSALMLFHMALQLAVYVSQSQREAVLGAMRNMAIRAVGLGAWNVIASLVVARIGGRRLWRYETPISHH